MAASMFDELRQQYPNLVGYSDAELAAMMQTQPGAGLQMPSYSGQASYDPQIEAMMARRQQHEQQGGMNPNTAWNIAQRYMGNGTGAGASTGAGAGTGATGAGAASTGAAGSTGGAGTAGGMGAMGWGAMAAAIIAHNEWARKKGLRDGESFYGEYGLTGRALYKDKDYYAERGNKILPGLGEDINAAASLSSPADLFRSETWEGLGRSLKSGGIVGAALKKLF